MEDITTSYKVHSWSVKSKWLPYSL